MSAIDGLIFCEPCLEDKCWRCEIEHGPCDCPHPDWRGECSIRRVGDREWYCDTHERPAEDCEAASDTERGDSQ